MKIQIKETIHKTIEEYKHKLELRDGYIYKFAVTTIFDTLENPQRVELISKILNQFDLDDKGLVNHINRVIRTRKDMHRRKNNYIVNYIENIKISRVNN